MDSGVFLMMTCENMSTMDIAFQPSQVLVFFCAFNPLSKAFYQILDNAFILENIRGKQLHNIIN